MKFKLGEEVVELASGKICLVVATKNEPWVKSNDPFMRKEVFAKEGFDYLLLIKVGDGNYSGELDAMEYQLNPLP